MSLFSKLSGKTGGVKNQAMPSATRAEALIGQGNTLEEAGELRLALEKYQAAVGIAPNFARAHLNQGNALSMLGDIQGAYAAYGRALTCDPRHPGAHFNLGNAYVRSGRLEEALSSYIKAIELDNEFADAHVATGCVLEDLGRIPEAIASFRRALAIRPSYAQVHSNLGNALRSAGRFHEAAQSQRRALQLDPSLAQAHSNLGNALKDLGQLADAEASYRQAATLNPIGVDALSNLLFLHNYASTHTSEQLFAEATAFGELVTRSAKTYRTWQSVPDPTRCLRIGLVSGDLRSHPVGYFLESIIAALANTFPHSLRLIAYATARCDDATAERIQASCHEWHSVLGTSDESLAQQIYKDAIDILIDLSGHTSHNRLPMFAWKPSPIQVSWLGYFATTGVGAIDYLVADPWTLSERQASNFTEKIWRLPETRLCFSPPDHSPDVSELPAADGRPLTFACFNNLTKVNGSVVKLWARVLAAVPASRLLLKSPQLQEEKVRTSLIGRFASLGINAERLVLEGLTPRFEYLSRYCEVDIALDPFPFPGGTTTVEALWMGVPVITLAGDSFLSRQGVGILINAGLSEWVAKDVDQYVEVAVAQASDLERLAQVRRGLRPLLHASPIMDAPRFAHHFEIALRGMWRRWCRSKGQ